MALDPAIVLAAVAPAVAGGLRWVRRRTRCVICRGATRRGQEVCDACDSRGPLGEGGGATPPPPA